VASRSAWSSTSSTRPRRRPLRPAALGLGDPAAEELRWRRPRRAANSSKEPSAGPKSVAEREGGRFGGRGPPVRRKASAPSGRRHATAVGREASRVGAAGPRPKQPFAEPRAFGGDRAPEAATFALGTLFGPALGFLRGVCGPSRTPPPESSAAGSPRPRQRVAGGRRPRRVLDVLDHADRLATDARLSPLIGADRCSPPATAPGCDTSPRCSTAPTRRGPRTPCESWPNTARRAVRGLHGNRAYRRAPVRWLATPQEPVDSVAQAVHAHLTSFGWADLAVGILAEGDTSRTPSSRTLPAADRSRAGPSYRNRQGIRRSDSPYGRKAQSAGDGRCLLIEDVLVRAAVRSAGRSSVMTWCKGGTRAGRWSSSWTG